MAEENGQTQNENGVEVTEVEPELLTGELALAAVDRAAIDIQVATAKQYPRSITKAKQEALSLATLDEETAAGCIYAIPRSGKTIDGPSVRLAEIMAYSWGNLRVDADIVAEDATHVTAMGTCFDLEKNVAVRVRVKRRITKRNGQRFDADMIGVTSNAAISIAIRNAVFKVIPHAFTKDIYQAARKASLGEGGTITQKRQNSMEWFGKLGVTADQVFVVLGVKGLDDIGEDQLITLRGLRNSIQEGETSVESVFHPSKEGEGTDDLNAALKDGNASHSQIEELRKVFSGLCRKKGVTKGADHEKYLLRFLDVESFDQVKAADAAKLIEEAGADSKDLLDWIEFQAESEGAE